MSMSADAQDTQYEYEYVVCVYTYYIICIYTHTVSIPFLELLYR